MPKKLTNQFYVESDDGHRYLVLEYTDSIAVPNFRNPRAEISGSKTLQTSDGMAVNYLSDNTYEVVQLGLLVHKM